MMWLEKDDKERKRKKRNVAEINRWGERERREWGER